MGDIYIKDSDIGPDKQSPDFIADLLPGKI